MTQWVIVAYLCSPLIAPSTATGCMFETFGPYPSEEVCFSANQSMPDPRTFTVRALVCTPLLAGQEGAGEPTPGSLWRYPSRQ
jgi:hypothetical protein